MLPSAVGLSSAARRPKKTYNLNRSRLGKSMSRLSAKYSQRYRRGGGSKMKVRAVQAGNLSRAMSGSKKPMKVARYFSPAILCDDADFAKPVKRMTGLVQKVARQVAKAGAVPDVHTLGRGQLPGKKFKPPKPKKKLKAKKVKGKKGYRGLSGAPPPQNVITAFNPSPFGGSAKTLGIKTK